MTTLGFWKLAQDNPDRVALIDPEGRATTAGELLASANQLSHGLRSIGLQRGDTISTVLPNGRPLVELYLAATQIGVYITPINYHLAGTEIAYIVNDCGAKALFVSDRFESTLAKAMTEISLDADRCFTLGALPGFGSMTSLFEGQPATAPDDRCGALVMTYTSGTTGKPRGVRRALPQIDPETLATNYASFLMLFGIMPGSPGVHLVVSPMYHTAVFNFTTNHLHLGQTVVLMDKWTPEGTIERINEYGVTSSHMVPTQFTRLLALPDDVKATCKTDTLTHMIHSAAPCPASVKRAMLDWWGPVIYEYYAASEGGGTLATPKDWLEHPGTVGKAWPISQILIVDDDKQPCDTRTPGTVYMKMGDHRFEYHKDKDKTDQAYMEGFFTVGDVGYLDDDGFLFLCDRKIDMIISGGVNIYPAEIESALIAHPDIVDVAVFGIPHDDWGEEVKAVVELRDGAEAADALAESITAFAKDNLAGYKCPRSIDFVDALPRDPSGKLYKRKLRDPYWEGKARSI